MSRRKGKKGMRKSQSESGMLPQMYSDNGSNDMGMGTDGRPRRIFQKKDLIEAVRRLSPGRGTPGMKRKMARTTGTRSTQALESGESATATTLRALETGVNMHARRYNELKMAANAKQKLEASQRDYVLSHPDTPDHVKEKWKSICNSGVGKNKQKSEFAAILLRDKGKWTDKLGSFCH